MAPPENPAAQDEIRFETEFSFSERERLAQADFESMTTAEYELAKKLAERAPLPVHPVRRRRHEAGTRGTLDLRRTLQGMARQPHTLAPAFTHPRTELPPIVVLLDISGSMDRYSRLFLHYVHGLTRRYLKVHTLTFGTRLTNITHCLKHRDPDVALKMTDEHVHDWKGGTRIASSLDEQVLQLDSLLRQCFGLAVVECELRSAVDRGAHDGQSYQALQCQPAGKTSPQRSCAATVHCRVPPAHNPCRARCAAAAWRRACPPCRRDG